MGVFVVQGFVRVFMRVGFGQVQQHAQQHQRAAGGQQGQCRSGRRPGLAGQRRQRKAGRSADGGFDQHHLRWVALGHSA